MPMKRVLHWLPTVGATVNTQILTEISQCIESLNGVKEGRWKAVLTFYKPIVRDTSVSTEFARDFMGLSLPEQPDKYYFIIRGQRLVAEADSNIQTIMDKLQSYKQRVSLIFEGNQYRLGDFQVRVGKVTPSQNESMRGIVMEAEYLPLSSIEKSRQLMDEFLDVLKETLSKRSLPGAIRYYEPNFAEYGLSDQYSPQHSAIQYGTVMAHLIATVQTAQPMRN